MENQCIDRVVESLYKGGIRIVEVTMNTPNALEIITQIKNKHSNLIVGAGTVLDSATARLAIMVGADFILAPTLDADTIKMGRRYEVPVVPGVLTPTEALNAYELGAEMVKVFPVRSVGADYAKDLRAPLPFLKFMGVGGISADNTEEFLIKGWDSLGIGSSLVSQKLIEEGMFAELENKARKLVAIRDHITNEVM